jgi:hypothetical protein
MEKIQVGKEEWTTLNDVDQWEHMAIGCNQLLTVAQDFLFGLLNGSLLIELKTDSVLLLLIFRLLIHGSILADPCL